MERFQCGWHIDGHQCEKEAVVAVHFRIIRKAPHTGPLEHIVHYCAEHYDEMMKEFEKKKDTETKSVLREEIIRVERVGQT